MDVLMNQLRQRLVWKENPGAGADYIPTGNTFGATTINDWMNPDREVSMRILMEKSVFPTNGTDPYYEYTEFDDTEIVSYSINEQCGEPGFQIGGTIAASFMLSIDNTQRKYVSADFMNTRFAVVIGLQNPGQTNVAYEPFGVFWCSNAHASEQSTTVDIEGMDALGVEYNTAFWPFADDDAAIQISYASVRAMMYSVVEIWQDITLETIIDDDGNIEVGPATYPLFGWKITQSHTREDSPAFPRFSEFLSNPPAAVMYTICNSGNITKRQMLGWVAEALGCFVAVGRDGDIELRAFDKNTYDDYTSSSFYEITPSFYFDYTPQDAITFTFDRLVAPYYVGNTADTMATYAESLSGSDESSPSTTIQLPITPFMTSGLAQNIYQSFAFSYYYLTCEGMTVSVVGAPQFRTGEYYRVTDLEGTTHRMSMNSMTTTYDGGLGMTLECNLPADATMYSSSYNEHASLISELKSNQYGKAQYSTEEMVTGTRWIDGKPLYRKVIHMTAAGTVSLTALNFDFIRLEVALGYTIGSGTTVYWCTSYYMSSNSYAVAYINGTDLIVSVGNNVHIRNAYIILEYTKASA